MCLIGSLRRVLRIKPQNNSVFRGPQMMNNNNLLIFYELFMGEPKDC